MPRHNQPKRQFIIRYKDPKKRSMSSLRFSTNSKSIRSHFGSGKILKIEKMSLAQSQKIGEFNEMPKKLMQEFLEERNKRPRTQLNISPSLE